ncbi:flagellin [Marinobacterium nitratireducens]|uniref:Flagellin n=1 Tax=Marinobacterium nitratireducens TaxID=518897 RepID=A0A918DWH9_9GAMM|nr:flagellin [Marinobacterium nitratireducens]GGO84938.1 flagellin [Marinobacterium nitratireducens]
MANVVATNTFSLSAQRHLAKTETGMATAMERLSSGLRVNSAKDDSAGLAIAERMNAQVRGMNVAIRNASDGVSLAQTAEGALQQVSDTLQRMRELAVQSANATNSASDRANLDAEFQDLGAEVGRILTSTEFNGLKVLAGDAGAQIFQVGANNAGDNQITVTTTDLSAAASITAVTGGAITDVATSQAAMDNIDTAIDTITTERATLGAAQNRFETTIQNLRNASENQAAARSRIMDADFAMETAALTKAQVLQQSGIAMLAQANQAPQAVLSLLR